MGFSDSKMFAPMNKPLPPKSANTWEYTFPKKIITNTEGHSNLWQLHHRFKHAKNGVITFHLPENCFIEANMSALLISICNKLKTENNISFEIGNCSPVHLDLFLRNGLISHLNSNTLLKTHDFRKTTVSTRLFDSADEQKFYDYIDKELLSHNSLAILDDATKDNLRQGFLETFNNIEHTDSVLPLAACGQCFLGRKNNLQFTLSDMGVGFLKKISTFTKGKVNTAKDAIAWAVEGNGNSVRGQGEGGLGLSRLRKYCEKDKRFTFIIITDNHYWKLSDGKVQEWSLNYPTIGTTIHLMVKLTK